MTAPTAVAGAANATASAIQTDLGSGSIPLLKPGERRTVVQGKAIIWAAIGVSALLGGITTNDLQFLVLGVFLLLFLFVAAVRGKPSIEVERADPALKIFAGDSVEVGVMVKNTGTAEADVVEVYDHAPGYARLFRGSNYQVLSLPEGTEKAATYTLHFPLRGYFTLGPVFLRTSDFFGFAREETLARKASHLPVFVPPNESRGLDVNSRAFQANMGPKHLNVMGVSSEFHSIRDYVKTDPFRKINWKVFARRRKLMVNTDEKETLSNVMLFLDSREVTAGGTPSTNFLEMSVRLATNLAQNLIRNNNRLGVVVYGPDIRIIPIGIGRNHTTYIQYNLIQAAAGGATTLSLAAAYAMPYLKPGTVIILLSPLALDTTVLQTVQWFVRMGHQVLVLTGSSMDYEALTVGRFTHKNVLDSIARDNVGATLREMGAQVVTFGPEDSHLDVLARAETSLEVLS